MQLTRLHLVVLVAALAGAGYVWRQPLQRFFLTSPESSRPKPEPQKQIPAEPQSAARTDPAPATQASPAQDTPAMVSKERIYRVTRGDTLWAIARDLSPVRAGPGWVGLWRANEKKIKNFDRLEEGLELEIPAEPQRYATRFWKPRLKTAGFPIEVNLAELPPSDGRVDLAELPLPRDDRWVDLAELPSPEEALAVDIVHLPAPEGSDLSAFVVAAFPSPAPLFFPSLHAR